MHLSTQLCVYCVFNGTCQNCARNRVALRWAFFGLHWKLFHYILIFLPKSKRILFSAYFIWKHQSRIKRNNGRAYRGHDRPQAVRSGCSRRCSRPRRGGVWRLSLCEWNALFLVRLWGLFFYPRISGHFHLKCHEDSKYICSARVSTGRFNALSSMVLLKKQKQKNSVACR